MTAEEALYLITKDFRYYDSDHDDVVAEAGCDKQTSKLIWELINKSREIYGK